MSILRIEQVMTQNKSFQQLIGSEELNFSEEHFAPTPDEVPVDRGSRIENELEELNTYVRVISNLKEKVIIPIQDIIIGSDVESPGIRCVKRICSHLIVIQEMVLKLHNYSSLYFNNSHFDGHKTFSNSASCLNAIIKAWEEYLVAYAEADAFEAFEEVIRLKNTKRIIDRGYEEFAHLCSSISFEVSSQKNGRSNRIIALKLACLLLLTHEQRASIVVLSNEFLISIETQTETEEMTTFKLICDKLARLTERNRVLQNQVNGTRKFWNEHPKLLNCLEVRDNKKLIILSSKDKKLTYPKWSSHSIGFVLFPDSLLKFTIDFLGNYEAQVLPLKLLWVYAGRTRPETRLQMQIIAPEVQLTLLCGSEGDRDYWVRAINEATIDYLGSPRQETNRKLGGATSSLLWPPQLRKCTYIFTSGTFQTAKYTGQWLEGKPNGKGNMIWPDGKFYMGDFRKGLFHGKGKYSMSQNMEDGSMDIYEGQFEEGQFNGYGVLSFGNSDRYEGEWLKGQRHGHGKFYLTHDNNYSVYIGEWANGKRSGFGIENSTEAEKSYHGMWREDIREGQGLTITTRDEYCACHFKENTLSGRGFIINGKGKSYEGWLAGMMVLNGTGELRLSDGTVMSGLFSGKWNEWVYMGSDLKITNGFITKNASRKKSARFMDMDWEEKALKYAASSEMKWCSLFEKCKMVLHLVEKDPSSPIRGLRNDQSIRKRMASVPNNRGPHSLQPDARTNSVSREHNMKPRPYAVYSVLPSDGIVNASKDSFDLSVGPVCMPPSQSTANSEREERKKRMVLDLKKKQKDRVRSSSNPEPYSYFSSTSPSNGKVLTRRASEMIRLDSPHSSDENTSPSDRTTPDLEGGTPNMTTPSTSTTPSNFSRSRSVQFSQYSMNISLESSSVVASPLVETRQVIDTSLEYSDFTNCEIAVEQIKKNLFEQLNTHCSSTSHPLGKLVTDLKDVIFESYAGIGASQYLLPHAIQDAKVFLRKLAEIVQKYAPFMIDEKAQLYGMIPKQIIEENSHLIDSYFISDLFLPRVYHTLFTLFSLMQEYNDSQYEITVAILSRMNCSNLMELFSINTPYPSDPDWYQGASQVLSTITQEYTIEGKLTILQRSVNTMLENLKDCKTELCTDVIIPYFQVVIIYARVKKLSTELHYIYTFMDPKLSQGEFGFLLTLLEGCYMMLTPDKIPCCL